MLESIVLSGVRVRLALHKGVPKLSIKFLDSPLPAMWIGNDTKVREFGEFLRAVGQTMLDYQFPTKALTHLQMAAAFRVAGQIFKVRVGDHFTTEEKAMLRMLLVDGAILKFARTLIENLVPSDHVPVNMMDAITQIIEAITHANDRADETSS